VAAITPPINHAPNWLKLCLRVVRNRFFETEIQMYGDLIHSLSISVSDFFMTGHTQNTFKFTALNFISLSLSHSLSLSLSLYIFLFYVISGLECSSAGKRNDPPLKEKDG
jgi:hypothetical protein